MDGPVNLNGFTVVRLNVNGESELSQDSCHFIYLKEHSIRKHHASKPAKRTLFVCNIPPYCNEASLKEIFEEITNVPIQEVFLHLKPEIGIGSSEKDFTKFFPSSEALFSSKMAYIVFRDPDGVAKSLNIPHSEPLVFSALQSRNCKTGVAKWCDEYISSTVNFDLSGLEKEIESFISIYDAKRKQSAEADKLAEKSDEEGWVKVSRKRSARFTEAEQQHQHRKDKKRKQEQELMHFYRFQLRESRREKIAELRKRFEEDKQRIALLRQQRKFKPF